MYTAPTGAGPQAGGHKALVIMEKHPRQSRFLVGDRPTIADICLYAYTHVAGDGGFDLAAYPRIQDWIGEIETLPGFVSMSDAGS